MKSLRVSEDIVPIGEFKGQAARWLRRVSETGQPVVITQNGKPAGVLLSPSGFDRLQERQAFLESIAKGVGDAVNQSVVITFMFLFVINFVASAIYFQVVPQKI